MHEPGVVKMQPLTGGRDSYYYGFLMNQESCVFCQIIRGEKEADFLYQDDKLVVFHDIRPAAPVHLLIVPKRHIRSINDIKEEDRDIIAEMVFRAKELAKTVSLDRSGYKLVFNTERGAGQVIFHLHMHLIGGWQR